jgi:hypothetical protein
MAKVWRLRVYSAMSSPLSAASSKVFRSQRLGESFFPDLLLGAEDLSLKSSACPDPGKHGAMSKIRYHNEVATHFGSLTRRISAVEPT